jgi:hypothetical protein
MQHNKEASFFALVRASDLLHRNSSETARSRRKRGEEVEEKRDRCVPECAAPDLVFSAAWKLTDACVCWDLGSD